MKPVSTSPELSALRSYLPGRNGDLLFLPPWHSLPLFSNGHLIFPLSTPPAVSAHVVQRLMSPLHLRGSTGVRPTQQESHSLWVRRSTLSDAGRERTNPRSCSLFTGLGKLVRGQPESVREKPSNEATQRECK